MATPNDAWPNRKLTATVVDTDPPQPGSWSSWSPGESSQEAWATKKKPQRTPRRLPRSMQPSSEAIEQGRPVGRWIAAAALWALAGGLYAGRTIATHVDAGVEAGMDWLSVQAPGFLRPYLPHPVPKLTEPRPHREVVAPPRPFEPPPPRESERPAAKEVRHHRHR